MTLVISFFALVVVSVIGILFQNSFVAYELKADGEAYAFIEDESVIKEAIDIANEKIKRDNSSLFINPTYKLSKVFTTKDLADAESVSEKLIDNSTVYTNAWAIYNKGEVIAALDDRDDALGMLSELQTNIIEKIKKLTKKTSTITEVKFLYDVDVVYEPVDVKLITNAASLKSLIEDATNKTIISYYHPLPGSSAQGLKDYDNIFVASDSKYSIDLMLKEKAEEIITLNCSTIFNYDETLDKGETIVDREGVDGHLKRVSKNTYINSSLIHTDVINEKLLNDPVSRIVRVGDRSLLARLRFKWPAVGTITSGFGPRYDGFHRGIDIAAGLGSEVKASAPGTVSFAGFQGSYGYVVFIDHRDGYQTRYAHLLKINVNEGDPINTGDVVGLMGSSGNSTGTHVHFEILKDENLLDPEEELN